MAIAGFTREELQAIHERTTRQALEEADASIRTALQAFGEAAANLAAKLPAESGSQPSNGWSNEGD